MRTLLHRFPALVLGLLIALTFVSTALADALVVVQVQTGGGENVDGQVTLRPRGGGESFSCTTRQGRCQIPRVPGGRYTVVFQPSSGEAPAPKSAMIPPSGNVTLHVSAN